jgi:hypothetical protein
VPQTFGTYTEVEKVDGQWSPKAEVEAARLVIEWKNLFARQLHSAARQLARGTELVTAEHYRQALPGATSKMLEAVKTHSTEGANVQRLIA